MARSIHRRRQNLAQLRTSQDRYSQEQSATFVV